MIKIGDYVHAELVGQNSSRQGVFTKDNSDGTIIVECESGEQLICNGPAGVVVVENRSIRSDTRQHVLAVRRRLGLEN